MNIVVSIRHWSDSTPVVAHGGAIEWDIFKIKNTPNRTSEQAPLCKMFGMVIHKIQAGQRGGYHKHSDREHIYFFTKGRGKLRVNNKLYDVKEGDSGHIPPNLMHQVINDTNDWVEHLIISGPV